MAYNYNNNIVIICNYNNFRIGPKMSPTTTNILKNTKKDRLNDADNHQEMIIERNHTLITWKTREDWRLRFWWTPYLLTCKHYNKPNLTLLSHLLSLFVLLSLGLF